MNVDDIRKAVKSLRGASIKPRCYNHKPKRISSGAIQCPNCYYTLYDLGWDRDKIARALRSTDQD